MHHRAGSSLFQLSSASCKKSCLNNCTSVKSTPSHFNNSLRFLLSCVGYSQNLGEPGRRRKSVVPTPILIRKYSPLLEFMCSSSLRPLCDKHFFPLKVNTPILLCSKALSRNPVHRCSEQRYTRVYHTSVTSNAFAYLLPVLHLMWSTRARLVDKLLLKSLLHFS